jgi:hypothetical protein
MKKENLKGTLLGWGLIFGCIGFFILIFHIGDITFRFHPVYKQGMEMISNDPNVIEFFGSPIQGGLFISGRGEGYRYGGDFVNLETTISGPEVRGTVGIMGTQTEKDGPWQVNNISVRIDDKLVLSYTRSRADEGFRPVRSEPTLDSNPPPSPTPPTEEPTEMPPE